MLNSGFVSTPAPFVDHLWLGVTEIIYVSEIKDLCC